MIKKTGSGRSKKVAKRTQLKMNEKFHSKLIIKEIEDETTSLTRMLRTKTVGFDNPETKVTIRVLTRIITAFVNYNYKENNYQRANAKSSFSAKRPQTYDERENNEQVAKLFYDQEKSQFKNNPRCRQYKTGSYNSDNNRDSTRCQPPIFRSNQLQSETTHWREEEIIYCEAITDFFPLYY